MKEITYKKSFVKSLKKIRDSNPKLYARVEERIDLFINNRSHPTLRDHGLEGGFEGLRAFSINGDVRLLYQELKDCFVFINIGTHNQVY
jgi:addiction module RelE/StbE family toxin